MNDYFNLLKKEFPNLELEENKILLGDTNICDVISFCKNSSKILFESLFTIVAIDYSEYIELLYILNSYITQETLILSTKVTDTTQSVITIFPSAHFDECEIYDLFGVKFVGNDELERLFLPKSWKGHPLLKKYIMQDERLAWNE